MFRLLIKIYFLPVYNTVFTGHLITLIVLSWRLLRTFLVSDDIFQGVHNIDKQFFCVFWHLTNYFCVCKQSEHSKAGLAPGSGRRHDARNVQE